MSKQSIAPTRGEGIPTPRTLANSAETVKEIEGALDDRAILPLTEGAERLDEIAGLFFVIRELVASARACSASQAKLWEALRGIDCIAQAAAGRAIEGHDFLANELETLRVETIPAILAALDGKK